MVSIESIKEFNNRLNQHKAAVQRVQTQVELTEQEVKRRLAQLSAAVGEQITEDNIEQYYETLKANLEKQLENGCAILDKIEGKVPANMNVGYAQQPINYGAQAVGYGQQVGVNQQPLNYGQQSVYQQNNVYAQPVNVAQPQAQAQAQGQPVNVAQPQASGNNLYAQMAQRVAGGIPTLGNMDAEPGVDLNSFGQGGVIGV